MNSNEMAEIQQLEKQVEMIDRKVSSILEIVKGNEWDREDRGMIGEINNHEQRLTSLEKLRDRFVWFLIGLSIPAGWGLVDIIQNIVLKK